jgi:hypothetical protein
MDGEVTGDTHLPQFIRGSVLTSSNGGFGHVGALENSGDCRSGRAGCA